MTQTGIRGIIFDWNQTLYDPKTQAAFPDARTVLEQCRRRKYQLAVASFVGENASTTLEARRNQILDSPLLLFFKTIEVTSENKDTALDRIVANFQMERKEILIVDDRVVRGIQYGNRNGHPTAWLKKGKFANETPDSTTGIPTFTLDSLSGLLRFI